MTIPEKVRKKLGLFCRQGGKVVTCTDNYEADPVIRDKDQNLRVTRRIVDEGTIYYLTNEAFEAKSGEVSFLKETTETACEINLLTGTKRAVSIKPYKYDLSFGEEVVLLLNSEWEVYEENIQLKNVIELKEFSFRKNKRIKIVPEGLVEEFFSDVPVKIDLGDWRDAVGEFFSGDAEYTTTFTFEDAIPPEVSIDLGEVKYSCEVFLNGKSQGVKIFSPFIYSVGDLKKKNELRIRVSNTMANAYANAKYEEWILDYEPSATKKLELEFEKESLTSGLFGPVLIKW